MKQLALMDPPSRAWKLDRKTIETGRKGIALARAALQEANERLREQETQAA